MRWLATALLVLFWLSGCVSETTRLERRFQNNPTDAETLYQLGLAYVNLGKFKEAVAELDTFVKLSPKDPKAAEAKSLAAFTCEGGEKEV